MSSPLSCQELNDKQKESIDKIAHCIDSNLNRICLISTSTTRSRHSCVNINIIIIVMGWWEELWIMIFVWLTVKSTIRHSRESKYNCIEHNIFDYIFPRKISVLFYLWGVWYCNSWRQAMKRLIWRNITTKNRLIEINLLIIKVEIVPHQDPPEKWEVLPIWKMPWSPWDKIGIILSCSILSSTRSSQIICFMNLISNIVLKLT